MSKTCFNIAEQKTKVINFIKKHKDILMTKHDMNITDEFIGELVKSNNNEFFRLASEVKLKLRCNFYRCNFYIFIDNFDNQHHMIKLWLPTVFSNVASDKANKAIKAITQFCSCNSFDDVIETRCNWFNMTPKRWETFEAIFDFYDKSKTSSKKTVKKTTKKTAKKTTKKTSSKKTTNTADKAAALSLNDFEIFMNDIVFN